MSSADVGTNVRVGILAAQMGEPAATQFIQEMNNIQDPMEVMNLAAAKLNSLGILRKMNCLRLWAAADKEIERKKQERIANAPAPGTPYTSPLPPVSPPAGAPAATMQTNPLATILGGIFGQQQQQQPPQAQQQQQGQPQWQQQTQQWQPQAGAQPAVLNPEAQRAAANAFFQPHPTSTAQTQPPVDNSWQEKSAAELITEQFVQHQQQEVSKDGLGATILKGVAQLLSGPTAVLEERPKFDVHLSPEQLLHFSENGYLQLHEVVPKPIVSKALAAINKQLGKGVPGSGPQAEAFKLVRGGLGYWPELAHTPAILDLLYKTPLLSYAELLIGKVKRCHNGQIALRFPGSTGCLDPEAHPDLVKLMKMGERVKQFFGKNDPQPQDLVQHGHDTDFLVPAGWKDHWHIDGIPNQLNSALFPRGTVMQFTMLVGVLLQDLPKEYSGNLAVFPGSHRVIQDYINNYNVPPEDVLLTSSSHDSPLPPIQFNAPPVQITGKAGDVVLCHYQTAHTVVPNASENVRYAVYFRLHHVDREEGKFRPAAMRDIWLEYDGIRAVS